MVLRFFDVLDLKLLILQLKSVWNIHKKYIVRMHLIYFVSPVGCCQRSVSGCRSPWYIPDLQVRLPLLLLLMRRENLGTLVGVVKANNYLGNNWHTNLDICRYNNPIYSEDKYNLL